MKKRARSIAIILVAFAVTFTSLPIMTGDFKAHAYSTPGQVRTFSATTYSSSSIRLTWKRPSACSGYVLYRNGRYLRVIPKTWTAYNVPGLKPATTYKFQMRTYNVYKRTQYYNSKYRTWTYSRPRYSQWRGRRTRRVNYYRYGKLSPVRTATTGPAKITGLKATAKTHDTTTIQWTKQTRALTGYVVYRNNAYYKTLGKNTNALKVTGLKASTAYTYKVRSYLKVGSRNVYGPWSANLKVTTNKAPAVVAPTPAVQDTKFANSNMANKTLYIDKPHSYGDLSWTLATTKEDNADSIKWTSSNNSVVTIASSLFNGTEATLTIKGKGTATITATNWDGQKKTATVTVKSVNDPTTGDGGTAYGNFALSGTTPTKIDKSASKEVTYTLPGSGFSASWTSSNPACVSVSTSGSNAIRLYAGDTFGQAVIKGTLSTPSGSSYTGQTEINITVQNTLYPLDSSGAYVMTIDPYGWPIVGGVSETRSPEQIILSLPRDAKVKMDIQNLNSDCEDWEAYGYGFLLGRNHTVETTTPNKVYIGGNYVYFYDAGTANLTIDDVRREFILTGRNDDLCNYFNFVNEMARNATGETELYKLQSITQYIASSANFSDGQGMNPANMYKTKVGDCINGAGMAIDIFAQMGYEAGYYRPSTNSSHQDVYVVVNGVTYYANCTPGSDAGTLYWYEDGVKKYNW